MKNLILFMCSIMLAACGTPDLSGTYVCKDIHFTSQKMSPAQTAKEQQEVHEKLVGRRFIIIQQTDAIWVGRSEDDEDDGEYMQKRSNTEYVVGSDEDYAVAKFSDNFNTLTFTEYDSRYTLEIICKKQ